MIKIKVTEQAKQFAKQQIEAFKKIAAGRWRYTNVEAWRGIVCEMLASEWFEQNFKIDKSAKGLDDSGIVDDCDMIINAKKVEIKSATKNRYRLLTPKIYDVRDRQIDIYIGCKYNEEVEPNEMQIWGWTTRSEILKCPENQDKGAPYYEVPLLKLLPINQNEMSDKEFVEELDNAFRL